MHRKKVEQIKAYAQIVKCKRSNGKVEEVSLPLPTNVPEEQMEV